jgi:flagellar biosynthetic protein FliR
MPEFTHAILQLVDPGRVHVLALVISRASGLLILAPIYGGAEVPLKVRALLCLAVALLVMPGQWDSSPPQPHSLLHLATFVGSELAIGYVLGLGIWTILTAMQLAGQAISQSGGLALAEVINPTGDANLPVISQFLYLLAVAIFAMLGGHRMVMAGLLETFAVLPLGGAPVAADWNATLTALLSQSCELGVRVAAPTVVALLLANVVLGLLNRTIPQLNLMVVGFGINALVTLGVLCLSLGGIGWVLQDELELAFDTLFSGLTGGAGG